MIRKEILKRLDKLIYDDCTRARREAVWKEIREEIVTERCTTCWFCGMHIRENLPECQCPKMTQAPMIVKPNFCCSHYEPRTKTNA